MSTVCTVLTDLSDAGDGNRNSLTGVHGLGFHDDGQRAQRNPNHGLEARPNEGAVADPRLGSVAEARNEDGLVGSGRHEAEVIAHDYFRLKKASCINFDV